MALRPLPTDQSAFVDSDGKPTTIFYIWLKSLFSTLTTTPVLVANLDANATAGSRSFVSNATATTFASVVVGGGANYVPVYRDNSGNWRIG